MLLGVTITITQAMLPLKERNRGGEEKGKKIGWEHEQL